MATQVPFQVSLRGDLAEAHRFEGYEGYLALAGYSWTLSLVTNYVLTGKIRQRGEFPGRHAVLGTAPRRGSVLADFIVNLENDLPGILHFAGGAASALLVGLAKKVIARNLGEDDTPLNTSTQRVSEERSGDVETLIAVTEAPIRQAHRVIGAGAEQATLLSGHRILNRFDENTKRYVEGTVLDRKLRTGTFSVSGFYGNSGHGSVYDFELQRNIPISMKRELLREIGGIFSWGLDQYVHRTGGTIDMTYMRVLSMDGRPKKYLVTGASRS